MTSISERPYQPNLAADDEPIAREKIELLIEEFESESPTRKLQGLWRLVTGLLAGGLALYALYWTQYSITTHLYRASFLLIVLVLTFSFYPAARRDRNLIPLYDILLILAAITSLLFLLLTYEAALQRVTRPTLMEVVMGGLLILLILEATRRTTGWPLTLIATSLLPMPIGDPTSLNPLTTAAIGLTELSGRII